MEELQSYYNKGKKHRGNVIFYKEGELIGYLDGFLKVLNNFKDRIELNLLKETRSGNGFRQENKLELDELTGENIINLFSDRDTIVINIKDTEQNYYDRALFIEKFYKKTGKINKIVYILSLE